MISIFRQLLVALLIAALLLPAASESKAISAGRATVTYDYDAFGNLIHSTGTTPNNYLFAGEQFDPDLGMYYDRARYLNTSTGRFWSMDSVDGNSSEPASLHKYLYTGNDPVNRSDPSGHDFDIGSTLTSAYISVSLTIGSYPTAVAAFQFASAALTLGLFATDEDFRAVYVASGGNPAQALATEFSTLLDEAGPTIAKDVVQDAATTDLSVGAKFARTDVVKPGERFVRVAATPQSLRFSFKSPGGATAGTYAFPEDVFQKIGQDPAALKDYGDLPGAPPVYYRVFEPPPGTTIQRGIVPGGQYGGRGGVPEVFFPEDF
ncbi:MAG TPA: RHS repeat-associated core domain-containing protein [Candidatus Eisenbacteria bacterium]|nr:RHS repeat-associated core domain-containing protein [Candidatus Eisenbacteria bacterium]